MQSYSHDKRIVLTLDAGGTNMDFCAVRGNEEITEHVRLPSNGDDLALCLQTIEDGFRTLLSSLDTKPVAISFAFPGPADYQQGIIGDLNNLPAFRGGVPLRSILQQKFNIPVFINNDADLFTYGEALGGLLPDINARLAEAGNPKQYRNLIGVTLGTGFGGGFVSQGVLHRGDNSLGGEIWLSSSRVLQDMNAEEGISIRAIRGEYARLSGTVLEAAPSPKEIASIARGQSEGNTDAAKGAFEKLGRCLGDVLANIMTLWDGLAVIGGGIAYEHELLFPAMFSELNRPFRVNGKDLPRLVQKVFNLEDEQQFKEFLRPDHHMIQWEGLEDLAYNPKPSLAIGVTKNGTRNSTSIGAYAYALSILG
jgi:glucokinase